MSISVHETARLGRGVVLHPGVYIGANVRIGDYCVIGGAPEHRDYYHGEPTHGVIIEDDVRIFEFVSIHAGTKNPTLIGKEAVIQNHSHIGHDSLIWSRAQIGGHASLAGHVLVMNDAIVGGRSNIHQHSIVGSHVMLAPCSFLKGAIPPGELWIGNPARPSGFNEIGLKRAGMDMHKCRELFSKQFQILKQERCL